MVTIREPGPDDARAIATVHVRAWQVAYRGGLMPDEYLDALSVDERTQMWAQGLAREPRPRFGRFVAEDAADGIIGFITVGPAEGDAEAAEGEVYAINVHPDAWGQGAGRALLEAGMRCLHDVGFDTAVLWVHPGNARARRFYERAGWHHDGGSRTQEVLGVEVAEVRYRIALAPAPT
jgi:RimJ/RimL family protein N-acetyltransferase